MSRRQKPVSSVYSIIIPAYNARATIKACLDAVVNQTVNRTCYEIIVVDDGSTDDTASIVESLPGIKLIRQKNQGPAVARNRGVAEANGEIVLFTDSDCAPTTNWIEEMTRPFKEDNDIVGVKGEYRTRQKEIIARFVQLEYEDKYDIIRGHKYIDFIDTYSAAFKKDVFLEAGGYDASFPVACAEDVELSYRLSQNGYKMVFNSEAIVYHIHPNTLISYLKKKYKFAYWRVLAIKKNPNKMLKDSYTPQFMKVQAGMPPVILVAFALLPFSKIGFSILKVALLVYLLTMVPFVIKIIGKDISIGLLSPPILFLRSFAQSFGLIGGIIGSKVSKDVKKTQ